MKKLFINNEKIFELIQKYGSPLYVYDENTLRLRCREMKNLLPNKKLKVNYSAKANSNLALLGIIKDSGIDVDAMSPGEIFVQLRAGFLPEQIFYIGNNVSAAEMQYAIDKNVLVSVDSLSQLDLYGRINPNSDVAVRFNPGIGVGHHEKVVTGGKKTKFGVQKEFISHVKELLIKHKLNLVGINQHIGSLFMDATPYIEGAKSLLEIAKEFPDLKFIDMGGGFGIPYGEDEARLDLDILSKKLDEILTEFLKDYKNKDVIFKVEPGRYISAECGILLGEVYSVKENYEHTYVGTDLGFNVYIRPTMYDAYQAINIVKRSGDYSKQEVATIVGNICESGDIIAKDRLMPKIEEGDIVVVVDAGAYGFAMSSNYNCRLKPAEILITSSGEDKLIRRKDTLEDIVRNF